MEEISIRIGGTYGPEKIYVPSAEKIYAGLYDAAWTSTELKNIRHHNVRPLALSAWQIKIAALPEETRAQYTEAFDLVRFRLSVEDNDGRFSSIRTHAEAMVIGFYVDAEEQPEMPITELVEPVGEYDNGTWRFLADYEKQSSLGLAFLEKTEAENRTNTWYPLEKAKRELSDEEARVLAEVENSVDNYLQPRATREIDILLKKKNRS